MLGWNAKLPSEWLVRIELWRRPVGYELIAPSLLHL